MMLVMNHNLLHQAFFTLTWHLLPWGNIKFCYTKPQRMQKVVRVCIKWAEAKQVCCGCWTSKSDQQLYESIAQAASYTLEWLWLLSLNQNVGYLFCHLKRIHCLQFFVRGFKFQSCWQQNLVSSGKFKCIEHHHIVQNHHPLVSPNKFRLNNQNKSKTSYVYVCHVNERKEKKFCICLADK